MKRNFAKIISLLLAILMLTACSEFENIEQTVSKEKETTTQYTEIAQSESVSEVEPYTVYPYTVINNNIPEFEKTDYTKSFEKYGELDSLGRCTSCIANIGTDLMPTEERGAIGSVKPTGWQVAKYSNVDGRYLYNRCHLIGYQLSAENANPNNLITGTRYLNIEGMLPFESKVATYVKATSNHVLYRVTPIFKDDELVARGVQMEAYSIEDDGEGVEFNVYCYNVQPDIEIDYKTGNSKYVGNEAEIIDNGEKQKYIVNINTKKFHKEDCPSAKKIKSENKKAYTGYKENLVKNGYSPCSQCNP
ncbi:MAG: DNA/RNA non-specific endonuclease [Eubacterium coprostanoligenes]|uniref:DNA/RNA non-specific endonuclease n=1 Tax=Eubacterium coprostanoligenes TaxID=290054 RepID=UPI00240A22FF|nr:DNA/RNA non-specific endonuclease [Eubacterium coprostanoligenes]MDD6665930.1 DNA/RNA non-specific endonuclease [Eubacterium coprostanoligenes]